MTIAFGIRVPKDNAVVLASDTLITWGNTKSSEVKLVAAGSVHLGKPDPKYVPAGDMAIMGAGEKGYMDAFSQGATEVFLKNVETPGEDLKSVLGPYVEQFYTHHILPFLPLPEDERPDIDMIIGIYRRGFVDLFVTDKTTLQRPPMYVAVGAGGPTANGFLSRWLRPDMNLREARVLAAYVVYLVKESVPECGKNTTIAALHPDDFHLPELDLKKLEGAFATKWRATEHQAVWKLIAKAAK